MSHSNVGNGLENNSSVLSCDDIDPKFWRALAFIFLQMKRYDDSLFNFNRCIEVNSNESSLWNARGLCLRQLRHEDAVLNFSKAVELDGSVSKYWYNRAIEYFELERYDEAISDLTTAIGIDGGVNVYWGHRGLCFMKLKRCPEALQDFNKVMSLNADDPWAWKIRGDYHFEMKEYELSESDYKTATECPKHDPLFWYELGVSIQEKQQIDPEDSISLKCFSTAISQHSNLPDCWIRQGDIYMKNCRFEDASSSFLMALMKGDKDPEHWLKHATSLEKCGKRDFALESYRAAIVLGENEPKYWEGRSMCYKEMGRHEEAEEDLKKAASLRVSEPSSVSASFGFEDLSVHLVPSPQEADGKEEVEGSGDTVMDVSSLGFGSSPFGGVKNPVESSSLSSFSQSSPFGNAASTGPSSTVDTSFGIVSDSLPKESSGQSVELEKTSFSTGVFGESLSPSDKPLFASPSASTAFSSSSSSAKKKESRRCRNKREIVSISNNIGQVPLPSFEPDSISSVFPPSDAPSEVTSPGTKCLTETKPEVDTVTDKCVAVSFSNNMVPVDTPSSEPLSLSKALPTTRSPPEYKTLDSKPLLESKVGTIAVEKWEQDIIDEHGVNLFDSYISIASRQESYYRLKMWLNLLMESVVIHQKTVCDILSLLSCVSQGIERVELAYDIIMSNTKFGDRCLDIATKITDFDQCRKWLRAGSSCESTGGSLCAFIESCFALGLDKQNKSKRCEAAAALEAILVQGYTLPFRVDAFFIDGTAVHSFLVRTLLSGSLNKNKSSPLYRSFFYSGLREVQLLPIVAGYLRERAKKGTSEREVVYDPDITSRSMKLSCLADIGLVLIGNPKRNSIVENLQILNSNLVHFLPIISPHLPLLTDLTFENEFYSNDNLDLSSLPSFDTSNLLSISIFRFHVISLSPLSLCDLSRLESLKIKIKRLDTMNLDGLTKSNTACLKTLSVSSLSLVDISALKDCDFSSLVDLDLSMCPSLSDISCLEKISFPSLRCLSVKHTKISDISVISTWKVFSPSMLDFSHCPIEDISPLSHLSFSWSFVRMKIVLSFTNVSDLSPLAGISCPSGKVEVRVQGSPAGKKILEAGHDIESVGPRMQVNASPW